MSRTRECVFWLTRAATFRVIQTLRAAGHDVIAISEIHQGAEDDEILELTSHESRIFITEDRDFGQLVYAAGRPAPGVIMLRFPSNARTRLPAMVVELVEQHGEKLPGRFVVVQPGRIRFGSIPR